MLDISHLRKDVGAVAERLRARGFEFEIDAFHAIESERKAVQVATEDLQARRNALSKQIGTLKSRGEDAAAVMAEAASIPQQLKDLEEQLGNVQSRLNELLLGVPNLPHASVPRGRSAEENVEVRRWGAPRNVSTSL